MRRRGFGKGEPATGQAPGPHPAPHHPLPLPLRPTIADTVRILLGKMQRWGLCRGKGRGEVVRGPRACPDALHHYCTNAPPHARQNRQFPQIRQQTSLTK